MRLLKIAVSLIVLALVVLGVFMWTLPADVAYRYGSTRLGPVLLSGLRGTFWNGHADGISAFGRDIGELDWHVRKLPVLTGRMVADIRIKGADVDVAGLMTRGEGSVAVRDLRFSLPANLLAPALAVDGLELLGRVDGVIAEASLSGMQLRDARGDARWSGAGVSGVADARFSDILAEYASQPDGSVAGRLHDDGGGDLQVEGHFNVRIGSSDIDATLRARDGNTNVADALRYIGEPQPDGSSRLIIHSQMLQGL
jgi:general secretion pathway protein N